MLDDEGYSGSQDNMKDPKLVSLEVSQDDNLLADYFTESPNLDDYSFDLMCAQASGFPESTHLPFENL